MSVSFLAQECAQIKQGKYRANQRKNHEIIKKDYCRFGFTAAEFPRLYDHREGKTGMAEYPQNFV